MVHNATTDHALIHYAGMLDGVGNYITGQEAAGKAQLLASQLLPAEVIGDREAFDATGIVLGARVDGDPLFVHATLPAGWKRSSGTGGSMWSDIVDEHGRPRVHVFYKAAFYDRRAHMSTVTVSSYAYDVAAGRAPLHIDEWATLSALREAWQAHKTRAEERLTNPIYAEALDTDHEFIASCQRLLTDHPGDTP